MVSVVLCAGGHRKLTAVIEPVEGDSVYWPTSTTTNLSVMPGIPHTIAARLRSRVDSAQTLFVSDFPSESSVRKIVSSHQQNLPDTTLFCHCLSLGRFTQWQFLANRDY